MKPDSSLSVWPGSDKRIFAGCFCWKKGVKNRLFARAPDRVHANVSSLHFAPFKADAGLERSKLTLSLANGFNIQPEFTGRRQSPPRQILVEF
jgi:hypothetical protein